MEISTKDFLTHYGVKGMKWGIRKEYKPSGKNDPVAEVIAPLAPFIVLGGILGANMAVKAVTLREESGKNARRKQLGKSFTENGQKKYWKQDPSLAKKNMSINEINSKIVKQINPGYGLRGTKENCVRCTFAYEMRRRGNDVAATRTTTAVGGDMIGLRNAIATKPGDKIYESNITALLKQGVKENIKQKVTGKDSEYFQYIQKHTHGFTDTISRNKKTVPEDVFNTLSKQPNGSRGDIRLRWGPTGMQGGHSMAYEVINGKAVIFDAQRNKTYTKPEELRKDFKENAGVAGFTRLDNRPLNEDFLLRWMVDSNG